MPNIFEMADNQAEQSAANNVPSATPPVEEATPADSKDATKAYSERLNADRAKIREEVRRETAESFGFSSWDEYVASQNDKVIREAGFDPAQVKPIFEKMKANDPDVVAAKELRAQQTEAQSKEQQKSDLFALNSKYGTEYTNVDELDDETKSLVSKGIALDKAYGIAHLDDILNKKEKVDPTKSHLNPPASAGSSTACKTVTPEEMNIYRRFNPNASDEDIYNFINKQ